MTAENLIVFSIVLMFIGFIVHLVDLYHDGIHRTSTWSDLKPYQLAYFLTIFVGFIVFVTTFIIIASAR